ncbi:hypothetical protein [Cellulomonas sp. HZM]|uniref:FitA-like ribbon-helix-helix domain-containing protein n=1 Tax=Cellulomonas sp. HZM TaxID=1454010 RepID=UPI0004935C74|nr:hypothetical protein [Cellulomonas sp. HZM]
MATLQVKNLPDELHTQLSARARRQGVTMTEYVTQLLRRDLGRPSMDEWLAAHPPAAVRRTIDVAAALDDVRVEYAPDAPISSPA